MRNRWLALALLLVMSIVVRPFVAHAAPHAADPKTDMQALDAKLNDVQVAIAKNDGAAARAAYQVFEDTWFEIEDGVRAVSRDSYRDIEDAMGDLKYALKQEPLNAAKATTALEALRKVDQAFIGAGAVAAPAPATQPASGTTPTLADVMPELDRAQAAIKAGNVAAATAAIQNFRKQWPDVEGVVKTKDSAAYRQAEDLMPAAEDLVGAGKLNEAATTLTSLETLLQPYATAKLTYTVFDAASILIREGLEALLVIAALLAFLQKSGNGDKKRWIWGGGIVGIIASVAAAVAIYALFSSFVTGANRELVEGVTGLLAAGMLFYVSYWLHSKTSIGGWQKYLKDRTNAALARGSLLSLSTLAFLSVFREGAETALFYIGIAPSIALRDLLLGLAIGTVLLTIVGVLVIGLGVRIPISKFFQVASLLIWYLGFKFIGSGIHALQVAQIVPASTARYLPASDTLGLFPTWETTLAQLALIVVAVAVVVGLRIVHTNSRKSNTVAA